MTDITKYKTITVPLNDWKQLDKMKKDIVPDTILSNSKVVSILINEKARKMYGKLSK